MHAARHYAGRFFCFFQKISKIYDFPLDNHS